MGIDVNYQAAAYNTIGQQHLDGYTGTKYNVKAPIFSRPRMRMNIVGIFVGFFVPWGLFCLLFAIVSFRIHYKIPDLCWAIVGICIFMVIGFGIAAALQFRGYLRGDPGYNPTWYVFLFVTGLLAVILGPIQGDGNFWSNMEPYYNLLNLNDYMSVDPTRMRGQQMMDAGRVTFLKGAVVDVRKAYAFQNMETYCVAPITIYNPGLGTPTPLFAYDFWAVGKNCCGGNSTSNVDFRCGAYNSQTAREGLRLMADDDRAFFRLAVQQAEAAHMVTATHPLFFSWTESAVAEMDGFRAAGYQMFAEVIIGSFCLQMLLVFIVSYIVSKIGYMDLLP
jgi:hypothetical protein|eukprot:CAMPEP_0169109016 /NCGR_PEP_ID=MMETSP1015-20121227/25739_1 /TAXON_ID=342587 /ORGANISM="Karlodinium micrum, Strain CCMP2283" /LENGTH=333 /DNA_ID=CAMNT_0009170683 /DNA_START=63 /DNA_END=1064 /DNA_ORIENTATION=+